MECSVVTFQPIDVYFNSIDYDVQFEANSKKPYTTEQLLQKVYDDTLTTGLYLDKMKSWSWKLQGKIHEHFKKYSPNPTSTFASNNGSPQGHPVSMYQIMPSILALSWKISQWRQPRNKTSSKKSL